MPILMPSQHVDALNEKFLIFIREIIWQVIVWSYVMPCRFKVTVRSWCGRDCCARCSTSMSSTETFQPWQWRQLASLQACQFTLNSIQTSSLPVNHRFCCPVGWWRGSVLRASVCVRRLSLSCARLAADGWPIMWVSHLLQVSQLSLSSLRGR